MKKIGIRFELLQTFDTNCLYEILKCLKNKNLFWYVTGNQTEVWADKNGNETFFKQKYNNKEFFDVVSNNHYAIFLKIQAYSDSHIFEEIHTIKEFENSDCRIILLIYDCYWCDIYIKEDLIDILYQNLIESEFDNINYIYDDCDTRTKLDI